MSKRHQRQKMLGEVRIDDVAREQRQDSDENQWDHRRDTDDLGCVCRAQYAAVLDELDRKHEHGAEYESRIYSQRQPGLQHAEVKQRQLPRIDDRVRCKQAVENVAGGESGTNRLDGRPCKPVTPYRYRRDDLAVSNPGDGAIHRGAARFIGEQAGDLGIGERLDEAERDRSHPNDPGDLSDGRRDGTDSK